MRLGATTIDSPRYRWQAVSGTEPQRAHERDVLLAEFRTAVVIRIEHGLGEDRMAVHYLLPYVWHTTMEVSMKFTALVAALALSLGSAPVPSTQSRRAS